nr:AMP-binding protein [Burkholderiaceae bacterium]
MTEHDRFRAARDQLLAMRTDWDAARAAFAWPRLEHFNWATDWFDAIARGNDAPALHIVEESGVEAKLSYAELSRRSSQVANFLAGLGARRGDRMLLMLGNEVPLWETMLAAIKLGVVVIPATTLLSGPDLADRLARGRVRWVLTNGTGLARVSELPADALAGVGRILAGDGGRDAGGAPPAGWTDYRDAARAPDAFACGEPIAVTEPLLEYFTSGTTSRPK